MTKSRVNYIQHERLFHVEIAVHDLEFTRNGANLPSNTMYDLLLFLFISWKLLSVRQLPYKPFKSFNIGYLACARWGMDLQYILRKNL